MRLQIYEIDVHADSVDAKWDDSSRSIRVRVLGSTVGIGFGAAFFYLIVLASHHGSSTWNDLRSYSWNSEPFFFAMFVTVLASALLGFLFLVGIRNFFPSGEKLHCDRSQFTVSKIPWMSFRGQWKTNTFSLAEISQLEYAIVQRGKGGSVYGISFFSDGKKQKLFMRIQAPEASHILRGLQNLGANVRHDPDMLAKIQAALRERKSQP